MLILNNAAINRLLTSELAISSVEDAFRAFRDKACDMPQRYAYVHGGMTSLFMPCVSRGDYAAKILNLVPENRARRIPSIDGIVLLYDGETGAVNALLDAKSVTAWRTGATGAMAVKYLAREDVSSFGIIGCGVQGLHQAICILAVRGIRDIYLYNRSGVRESFLEGLRPYLPEGCEIHLCTDIPELCEKRDIIVTTTFATEPLLPADPKLLTGKCIVAVGSYTHEMREIPDFLFTLRPAVFADLPYACEESGDLFFPIQKGLIREEDVRMIHSVLDRPEPDPAKGKTVLFKTVGMALLDLYAAEGIYRLAKEQGLGQEVEF